MYSLLLLPLDIMFFQLVICINPSFLQWQVATAFSCTDLTTERNVHHSDLLPVSEMTYTVLSGTLNSSIPYHTIQTF